MHPSSKLQAPKFSIPPSATVLFRPLCLPVVIPAPDLGRSIGTLVRSSWTPDQILAKRQATTTPPPLRPTPTKVDVKTKIATSELPFWRHNASRLTFVLLVPLMLVSLTSSSELLGALFLKLPVHDNTRGDTRGA